MGFVFKFGCGFGVLFCFVDWFISVCFADWFGFGCLGVD